MTRVKRHNKARGGLRIIAGLLQAFSALAAELRGAAADHRKWIESRRARLLGNGFALLGRLLRYGVYIALGFLVFNGWRALSEGFATGAYGVRISFGETPQLALFIIFAAALLFPIGVILGYLAIGLTYNLTRATAFRILPRFAEPIVPPTIVWIVFAFLSIYQELVVSFVGHGYVNARAVVVAALPRRAQPGNANASDQASDQVETERLRVKLIDQLRCKRDEDGNRHCESRHEPTPDP